jgi:hypothetical protein
MIPMTIQTKATTAPLPRELRTAADATVPISIEPSTRTTTDHGGRPMLVSQLGSVSWRWR